MNAFAGTGMRFQFTFTLLFLHWRLFPRGWFLGGGQGRGRAAGVRVRLLGRAVPGGAGRAWGVRAQALNSLR